VVVVVRAAPAAGALLRRSGGSRAAAGALLRRSGGIACAGRARRLTLRKPTSSPKQTTLFTRGSRPVSFTSWKMLKASTPVKVRCMGEEVPGREVYSRRQ